MHHALERQPGWVLSVSNFVSLHVETHLPASPPSLGLHALTAARPWLSSSPGPGIQVSGAAGVPVPQRAPGCSPRFTVFRTTPPTTAGPLVGDRRRRARLSADPTQTCRRNGMGESGNGRKVYTEYSYVRMRERSSLVSASEPHEPMSKTLKMCVVCASGMISSRVQDH